jgi:hypothetical protein
MKIVFTFFILLTTLNISATELTIYDPPEGAEAAPEFELTVNDKPVFVYNSRPAAFACFSFEGKVDIEVKFLSPVIEYDIRPLSRNIKSIQIRNTIHFSLDQPEYLSIEINKNIKRPLFIFADPPEKDVPQKGDKNVIFFEAGKIHYPGEVKVSSNQTVYIEGGAIVRGHFMTDRGKNIRIMGRGILDNSRYMRGEHRPIEINRCEQVLIQGIIIMESRHWTCASHASKDVRYDHFKVVSANDWDDAIDIVGSQNVTVDHCFLRSKDDCIAIKAGVNYFTDFNSQHNVDRILVQNSVLWNGVWGNAMEIGFETRADTIKNVTFRNCDIIHAEGSEGTFTIHNGDRAVVSNVLYDNIRVEDAQGWLIDFKILESRYSKDKQRGKIMHVRFRNIHVGGERFPYSQLMGFSDDRNISDVVLEDFYIHDQRIRSTYDGEITMIHTEGFEIR